MKSKLEYIMFFTFNSGFTSIKFDYSWLHIPDFINRFWKFIPSAMIVIKNKQASSLHCDNYKFYCWGILEKTTSYFKQMLNFFYPFL